MMLPRSSVMSPSRQPTAFRVTNQTSCGGGLGSVDDAVLLVADDVNGNLVGCATASTIAALGLGNVHINMLALPHGHETLRQLADAIEQWHGAARTDALFAHVSGPTLEQEDDWLAAGFERVGTRARLARAIMPGDAEFQGVEVAGITIAALAHEPGLEDAALTLWNGVPRRHTDVVAIFSPRPGPVAR